MKRLIKMKIVLSLLVILVGLPSFAAPDFDAPGLERAKEAQEIHTEALMARSGFMGTGVGYNDADESTIKPKVHFFVKNRRRL